MGNLESVCPRLIEGKIYEEDDSFRFENKVQKVRLQYPALKAFRLMDGSHSLEEIARKVYAEEKSISFRQLNRLVRHLAGNKLLENHEEVENSLISMANPVQETAEDFDSRVKSPGMGGEIDLNSSFLASEIARRISTTPLFRGIDEQKLIRLADNSKIRKFQKGLYVVTQGAQTSHVFVLLSGSVGVFRNGREKDSYLATLYPNSVFGEYAAFLGIERNADVVTLEPSDVLIIDIEQVRKGDFNLKSVAGLQADVPLYDEIKRNVVLSQTLHRSELFKSLPLELIQLIIAKGKMVQRSDGDIIIREGDVGKSFYLIVSGGVSIIKNEMAINHHSAGDFFGEISLIKRVPRTATVRAATDVVLLQVTRDDFYDILSQNMFLALFLEKEAEKRLGQ